MADFLRRFGAGLLVLTIGTGCLLYGIHRREHETVAKKSTMVCLECIGIG